MQAPKNNLQEVLRRKLESGAASISPAPISSSSSKKFKPAPTTSGSAARTQIPSTLPSFSTPGFRRGQLDVFSVSSDSAPSSPPRTVKRTSSDASVTSDPSPQLLKRQKKDITVEKENEHIQHQSKTRAKGKQKESPLRPVHVQRNVGDDEEPWLRLELDTERNPFTKLDRDYPAYIARSTVPLPELPERDKDLLSKDLETLRAFLFGDYDVASAITEKELAHHRGSVKNVDITMLQRLSSDVSDRISSIKKVIVYRETQPHIQPAAPPSLKEGMPSMSPYTSFTSTARPATVPSLSVPVSLEELSHVTSNRCSKTKTTPLVILEDDEPMPASEADYWAGVDDLPIDDTFSEDPYPSTAETTVSLLSTPASHDLTTSPHHAEIKIKLKSIFGLEKFRHNQLEAITEALSGRDVFVLMPTGGGKSLCYQLPAVCQGGKTKGVTVVVSPLLALMKDQVQALEAKHVDVFLWNSEAAYDEAIARMRANKKPSLVYITPEKLKENNTAQRILGELYRENCLARFVIDEAHCISTWGQDFRDAYQHLGNLRLQFPNVPIMALTATARKITVDDITARLKLRNHVFLKQSFNRPNLRYVIELKTKKWMEAMIEFIRSKHYKKSGVVYCLGRDKCEEVAKKLNENGLSAKHFHAGMSTADKDQTLDEWRSDKVHIIVATIAFGMGIDKPDVRFVIHYSLPKSLDGYYQETGRAGRDGKPADCILYFMHKDFIAIRNMIERPDVNNVPPSKDTVKRQIAAARAVVDYCMDISECRRVQLLHYFDERFDKAKCGSRCDNCANPDPLATSDLTEEARHAVELVETFQGRSEPVTLAQCRDILKGANTAAMRNKGYDKEPLFGCARDLTGDLPDLILRKLCQMDVIVEKSMQQASGYHSEYVQLGSKAKEFRRSQERVEIHWRQKPAKASGTSIKAPKKQVATKPPSSKRAAKGKQKAIEADPIESYEDDSPFELSDAGEVMVTKAKRTWPPHRAASTLQPLAVEDDIEISEVLVVKETAAPVGSGKEPSDLYKQMCGLRNQIMIEENILNASQIFDDGTLQYLAAMCPQDYKSFTSFITDEVRDEDEATAKFRQFGTRFLQLCIEHKLGSGTSKALDFDVEGLRTRFEYQQSSAFTSARKSKFKPHR